MNHAGVKGLQSTSLKLFSIKLLILSLSISQAVSGAGLLFLCVPPESRGWLGVTQIVASSHNGPVSTMVGCAVEFVTTFVFVHTVLVCTEGGSIIADRLVALMLGLAVTACHLFGVIYSYYPTALNIKQIIVLLFFGKALQ